jgi:hypothetical protein
MYDPPRTTREVVHQRCAQAKEFAPVDAEPAIILLIIFILVDLVKSVLKFTEFTKFYNP